MNNTLPESQDLKILQLINKAVKILNFANQWGRGLMMWGIPAGLRQDVGRQLSVQGRLVGEGALRGTRRPLRRPRGRRRTAGARRKVRSPPPWRTLLLLALQPGFLVSCWSRIRLEPLRWYIHLETISLMTCCFANIRYLYYQVRGFTLSWSSVYREYSSILVIRL